MSFFIIPLLLLIFPLASSILFSNLSSVLFIWPQFHIICPPLIFPLPSLICPLSFSPTCYSLSFILCHHLSFTAVLHICPPNLMSSTSVICPLPNLFVLMVPLSSSFLCPYLFSILNCLPTHLMNPMSSLICPVFSSSSIHLCCHLSSAFVIPLSLSVLCLQLSSTLLTCPLPSSSVFCHYLS